MSGKTSPFGIIRCAMPHPALRSHYGWVRLPVFVHHRLTAFPSRCGPEAGMPWPNPGSPKLRRDPFARDLLFDPGGADMASLSGPVRVAFDSLHGLGSCDDPLRGSITHPTQPLCTLRGRRRRRLTQHLLPGCLLGITWVGLAPIAPALLGDFAEEGQLRKSRSSVADHVGIFCPEGSQLLTWGSAAPRPPGSAFR